jgi:hypothetical protein
MVGPGFRTSAPSPPVLTDDFRGGKCRNATPWPIPAHHAQLGYTMPLDALYPA